MKVNINIETVQFPFSQRPSLKNITLKILGGEIVQVCGLSGSGKTTLCYTIAGIIPDFINAIVNGKGEIDGRPVSEMPGKERTQAVAVVTEDPLSSITQVSSNVEEEISISLHGAGFRNEEIVQRAEQALERFGIFSLKKSTPSGLSGGQQVRLVLASVTALRPKIYIIDDGIGHLDNSATTEFFEYLELEAKSGAIVIYVSNKLVLGAKFAHRIIALSEGQLAFDGKPQGAATNDIVRLAADDNPYFEFYRKVAPVLKSYKGQKRRTAKGDISNVGPFDGIEVEKLAEVPITLETLLKTLEPLLFDGRSSGN